MMDDVLKAIREQQQETPDREVCGFVLREQTGLFVMRAENIAPNKDQAAPDARALRAALTGDRALVYVYHTHLHDHDADTDQPYCDAFGVPYLIVSPHRVQILRPTPPWTPLVEKRWEWGVMDCANLCFKFADIVHGIGPVGRLPAWPDFDTFDPAEDNDFFHEVHEGLGFVTVQRPWRFGDFISFRIPAGLNRRPGENHLAVYLGDNRVLQVFRDGVVHECDLDERLVKYVAYVYRWLRLERCG